MLDTFDTIHIFAPACFVRDKKRIHGLNLDCVEFLVFSPCSPGFLWNLLFPHTFQYADRLHSRCKWMRECVCSCCPAVGWHSKQVPYSSRSWMWCFQDKVITEDEEEWTTNILHLFNSVALVNLAAFFFFWMIQRDKWAASTGHGTKRIIIMPQ